MYITGRRLEKLQKASNLAVGSVLQYDTSMIGQWLIFCKEHGKIIPIQGSVTSHDDVQRAVDFVTEDTGYIDLLVNNAGMTTFDSSPNARPKPTPQSSISEIRDYYFNHRPQAVWRDTLETNIAAVFTTSMAFLELLDAGSM